MILFYNLYKQYVIEDVRKPISAEKAVHNYVSKFMQNVWIFILLRVNTANQ
jgi:hypothetical protein